jgi:retinol dehydrogenase 14
MRDKVGIVTGANSGMGKVTAKALAQSGCTVIMVCRNFEKGKRALKEINRIVLNAKLELIISDLSSQKEIRELASEIKAKYTVIDILVNNAGSINDTYTETIDGIENTFATNHLGYFLLTNLLLDNLMLAPKARIVNVASEASRMGKINFKDINLRRNYSALKAYSQSKLANILFTYELARKLEGTRITVNCLHPGVVNTNFGKDLTGIKKIMFKIFTPFLRTPEKGAETILWLAMSPEVENLTGKYFTDKKEIKSVVKSYDLSLARDLWGLSQEMTGM